MIEMNVLSLFDGISCARVALDRLGNKVKYYASEIDKYAIQVAMKNYPDTIQLGDVRGVTANMFNEPIDLLIGGSPCQDLSIAKANRKGLDGERSGLFWEYVRILKEVRPRYFVLENVNSMPREAKRVISDALGVEPIMINAALVSAQNRKRLFWTNIPGVILPDDRGILLRDILESGEAINLRGEANKSYCIDANYWKSENIKHHEKHHLRQLIADNGKIRKLTPVECERLQSLPDGYTEGISNTQRYRCLGNAFNVDVVKHILSFMYGYSHD